MAKTSPLGRGFRCQRTAYFVSEGDLPVMTFLLWVLVVLHVIISLFLIGVVLLQTGKSADLAGAFGGQGSQTAFGPRGAANLLTKLTTYAAILFMFTSVGLTIVLSRTAGGDTSVLQGSATAGKK